MRGRAVIAALGAIALTGCAGSPEPTTTDEPAGQASDAPASEIQGVCGLVTADELESIFGVALGEGRERQGTVGQNDVVWSPDRCVWEVENVIELELRIAEAADFESGELVCLEPTGRGNVAVDSLGIPGWWRGEGLLGSSLLRACDEEQHLDIDIDGEGSPGMQAAATELAALVLSRL